jgi:fructuronate reductase
MPAGTDLAAYSASLLQRFANPALRHRTWQIAMDGSQKLPQRLLGTMQDRLRQGLPIDTHALAVAGWMRYVTATDEKGQAIEVRDPLAPETRLILPRRPARSRTGWRRRCSTLVPSSANSAMTLACAAP